MNDNQWLQDLKVGDEVYVPVKYGRGWNKYVVKRLTRSQIIVTQPDRDYEIKYRKKNGRSVGTNTWDTTRLYKPTKDMIDEFELSSLTNRAIYMRDNLHIPQTKE